MRREHQHPCSNKALGCPSQFTCHAHLERDEDGWHCVYEGDIFLCEDCDTSRCSECGSVLNVETHDTDCIKATAV